MIVITPFMIVVTLSIIVVTLQILPEIDMCKELREVKDSKCIFQVRRADNIKCLII